MQNVQGALVRTRMSTFMRSQSHGLTLRDVVMNKHRGVASISFFSGFSDFYHLGRRGYRITPKFEGNPVAFLQPSLSAETDAVAGIRETAGVETTFVVLRVAAANA